jgi:hypothetical protein
LRTNINKIKLIVTTSGTKSHEFTPRNLWIEKRNKKDRNDPGIIHQGTVIELPRQWPLMLCWRRKLAVYYYTLKIARAGTG